jgi:DNA-binding response OmpR family regulator
VASSSTDSTPFEVLIVEDEYLIGMELVQILEDSGYVVIGPIATVSAAVATIERSAPSACILDVNLRGEISAPVADCLKAKQVPFFLSSGYKQETINQERAFSGVTNIGKPAKPEQLVFELGRLLKA